jgi:hypothetical protein
LRRIPRQSILRQPAPHIPRIDKKVAFAPFGSILEHKVPDRLADEHVRDADIVRHDRARNETRRWTLHGAWVRVLEYHDLEGGSTDNSIEKLTIAYQYWRQ